MTTRAERRGKIQTVLGLIDPGELGSTLMHEHILCDLKPPDMKARNLPDVEITLENCWEIRYHWGMRQPVDLRLEDELIAILELTDLREAGCTGIVELSCGGMNGNPEGLQRISKETGIHIIYGVGNYIEEFEPPEVVEKTVEQIRQDFVDSINRDVGDGDTAAGIIGEIGCSHPWTDFERRTVEAAAIAQQETGAAIIIHPGRHPNAPHDHVTLVKAAGGNVTRTIISHIERTIFDLDALLRLVDTGCVIEFDFFGIESSYYVFQEGIDLPNDGMRLNLILDLIRRGYRDQVVISHDICNKTRLRRFGGHGYAHIFRNVVPIMRTKGFSENDISGLVIDNPRRCLTLI